VFGKSKPKKEPRVARAARAFFEPWQQMPQFARDACRVDLEVAGAAMERVFAATGNADEYAKRLLRLALLIGSSKLLGKSMADTWKDARPGVPTEWWPFLDQLFGRQGSIDVDLALKELDEVNG
jgi:hypothetical protein